jgi:hypothetical protein
MQELRKGRRSRKNTRGDGVATDGYRDELSNESSLSREVQDLGQH